MNIHPKLLEIITKDYLCPSCNRKLASVVNRAFTKYTCDKCLVNISLSFSMQLPATISVIEYDIELNSLCVSFDDCSTRIFFMIFRQENNRLVAVVNLVNNIFTT